MQRTFEQRASVPHTVRLNHERQNTVDRDCIHIRRHVRKPCFVTRKCGLLCCRSHAIACVNQFIISRTQALMLHIDPFVEASQTAVLFYCVYMHNEANTCSERHTIISLPLVISSFRKYMLQH